MSYIMHLKKDYPNVKISLSKFCTLKPKWCTTINASGTYNVSYHHQKTIFLIDAIRWNKSYNDLNRTKKNKSYKFVILLKMQVVC